LIFPFAYDTIGADDRLPVNPETRCVFWFVGAPPGLFSDILIFQEGK
jgi:hypothetical protein